MSTKVETCQSYVHTVPCDMSVVCSHKQCHVTCQSHVHTVPCDMSHLYVTIVCQKDLVLGDVDLATQEGFVHNLGQDRLA